MTPERQVAHVMAKDLREGRWSILAYIGVVVIATTHSLGWKPVSREVFNLSMFAVVLFGMVLAASVVQADSPTAPKAFWATRPFSPAAMLAAKLCLTATVIVLPALVGQTIALRAHEAPSGQLAGMLAGSSWRYGVWLLAAMIAAALTRDLKTFLITLVFGPAVFLVVAAGIFPEVLPIFPSVTSAAIVTLIGVVATVALLAALYRTRDGRRRMWAAGALAAGALLASFLIGARPGGRPAEELSVLRASGITARLEHSGPLIQSREFRVIVELPDPGNDTRLVLFDQALVVRLSNGSSVRLPGRGWYPSIYTPPPALPAGVSWRGSRTVRTTLPVTVELTDDQRSIIARGVAGVTLEAKLLEMQAVSLGTISLVPGASVSRAGTRFRLTKWNHAFDPPRVEATINSLQTDAIDSPSSLVTSDIIELALVNASKGEAVSLNRNSDQSGPGWLVLPGVRMSERAAAWEPTSRLPTDPRPVLDAAWLSDARLAVWEWQVRNTYAVRAEIPVP